MQFFFLGNSVFFCFVFCVIVFVVVVVFVIMFIATSRIINYKDLRKQLGEMINLLYFSYRCRGEVKVRSAIFFLGNSVFLLFFLFVIMLTLEEL